MTDNNDAYPLSLHVILNNALANLRYNTFREPDEYRPDRTDYYIAVTRHMTESPEWLDWRFNTSERMRSQQ